MPDTSRTKYYLILSCLSLEILTLQIVLSLLLRTFTSLPFLAVSFAFLGLSAAGVFFFIKYRDKAIDRPLIFMARNILLFGTFLLGCVTLITFYSLHRTDIIHSFARNLNLPFDKLIQDYLMEILVLSYLMGFIFSVIFFFIGLTITMIYRKFADTAPQLYLFDLLGAAAGCVLGVVLLHVFYPGTILIGLSLIAFLLVYFILRRETGTGYLKHICILLIVLAGSMFALNLRTNIYEIRLNANILANDFTMEQESREIFHRWNSYSRVALVQHKYPEDENYAYNFAIDNVTGRALLHPFDPDNPYPFKLFEEFKPVTLGFLLAQPREMLILFAGAGIDMLEAYSYSKGEADITGVEINPLIVREAMNFPGFHLKEFFDKDNVHMIVSEGRSFLEKTDRTYDSIILSWAGASLANYLGTAGYTGQYLYTKEAIQKYYQHLNANGTIGIVNGNKMRLLLMIRQALMELGIQDTDRKIIVLEDKALLESNASQADLLSDLDKKYVLIKNQNFTQEEINRIDGRLPQMGLAWLYNPYYVHPDFIIFRHILQADNPSWIARKLSELFHIDFSVPSDNRPFMQNNFRVGNMFTAGFWSVLTKPILSFYPSHFFIHICMIIFILLFILIGFLFIIVPLLITKKIIVKREGMKFLTLFALLGLGFMFVEITVMQQFNLFLGNPIYAFSVILASLLLTTGAGSLLSHGLFEKGWLTIQKQALVIVFLLILYYFALPKLIYHFLAQPLPVKFAITFLGVAPLGLCLGMPFPQGLKLLHKHNPAMIPWAWAMNGYMSVVGSLVSYYLSFALGFSIFFLLAAFFYLVIAVINWGQRPNI